VFNEKELTRLALRSRMIQLDIRIKFFIFILVLVFFSTGSTSAGEGFGDNVSIEPPQGVRDKLSAEDLWNGNFPELIHNDYFMPIGSNTLPAHQLSGVIRFSETIMNTTHPDSDWKGRGMRSFPGFSIPVISYGEYLIPLTRGIIVCGDQQNSYWNIIVSPGRVWQEPGDNGYSRASFPFTFTDNYIGQARNGLATFIYNSSEISDVAIQITQETAPVDGYVIANFRGMIPVRYSPQYFEDMEQQFFAFEKELASRPPVRSWNELPLAGFTQDFFRGGLSPEEVSTAAMFLDGQLYIQPAYTRTGPYPYPLEMRHGVLSVTKSLAMGLSMFFAAERYGEDLFGEEIVDYVSALAGHPGWQGVTFEDAFCMATGTQGGETGDNIVDFIYGRTTEDKLAAISVLPDAPAAPGTEFNYASTNTFVVSYALNQYVKAKEGPDADYWLLVKENVLRPLGIPHLPLARTLEREGELGTPIMGWGSYPTVLEAAKIGQLLHNEGKFNGQQILNEFRVKEALYRTFRSGYDAGNAYGLPQEYLHSMWINNIGLSIGVVTVPSMSGHGGNEVVILPSGVIVIRFGDSNHYDISHMVAVAEFYSNY
jgi:CubicO group peptidase (beta-lactamase class C family)